MPPEGSSTPPASPPALLVLGYGHAPSRVRRWGKRFMLLAWIAGFLWLAYDKWGVYVRVRATYVYEQQQCARHTEPADRVVFDSNPLSSAALLRRNDYRVAVLNGGINFGNTPTAPTIAVYTGFSPASDRLAAWRQVAQDYQELWDPPVSHDPSTRIYDVDGGSWKGAGPDDTVDLFLHARQAKGRPAFLIHLTGIWFSSNQSIWFMADADALSWTGDVKQFVIPVIGHAFTRSTADASGQRLRVRPPTKNAFLRLRAGQPDPSDASRFTVRYEVTAGGGTIELKLHGDDAIRVRVLDGPMTLEAF
jgi:hypothetical protein